jgi:hypothetical protein
LRALSGWCRGFEKENLAAGDFMKKLRLLVDVLRAMRLVMSYLGDDGARIARSRAVTRIND